METKRIIFTNHGEGVTKVKCIVDSTLSKITFLHHNKTDVCGDNDDISLDEADEFISNCIWKLKHDFNTDNFNDDDIYNLKRHLFKEIKDYVFITE